jgi:predicted 2-oxoglutarate/Fe(II)-dependent dioxygenase YbiX
MKIKVSIKKTELLALRKVIIYTEENSSMQEEEILNLHSLFHNLLQKYDEKKSKKKLNSICLEKKE